MVICKEGSKVVFIKEESKGRKERHEEIDRECVHEAQVVPGRLSVLTKKRVDEGRRW